MIRLFSILILSVFLGGCYTSDMPPSSNPPTVIYYEPYPVPWYYESRFMYTHPLYMRSHGREYYHHNYNNRPSHQHPRQQPPSPPPSNTARPTTPTVPPVNQPPVVPPPLPPNKKTVFPENNKRLPRSNQQN